MQTWEALHESDFIARVLNSNRSLQWSKATLANDAPAIRLLSWLPIEWLL